VDSYTTILLVYTPGSILLKAGFNRSLGCDRFKWWLAMVFGLVKDLASWESVVNACMDSYSIPNVFCVVFAVYQPLRSQYSHIILSLDFWSVTPCPLSAPASHPFVSTHDTMYHHSCNSSDFLSYLAGNFKAAISSKGSLKGNKLMHTVCKFHMRTFLLPLASYNRLKSLKPLLSRNF